MQHQRNMILPDHPIFQQIPDLWQHIVETMDEALFLVDLNRDIIYFNRRAEEITGYTAGEVLGRHCLAGFRCPSCASLCGLFEQQKIADREVEITRKDGGKVVVLKNAVVLRDQGGTIIGGLETFRDITPLKVEMERCGKARLRAEERGKTLEAVLLSIKEGIIALDPERRVVSISRRAREILGLEEQANLVGQSCKQVLGLALYETACPSQEDLVASSTGPRSARVVPGQTALTVAGRKVQITEGLSPLVDDDGQTLGLLLVITELPADAGVGSGDSFHGLIGRSRAMREVFERIDQLSHSEVTVLVTGESGTGKELAAKALHETSPRSRGPFLAVNCAALPEGLLESEIFGHVKGAFTGALRDRKGRVELAQAGTLFLDEVGELSSALQAKLLRLVQERTFERVGEETTRSADIRIVAATHRDLEHEVAAGRFRADLYYRLKVVPLRLPALRQRGQDIALIAARLLEGRAKAADRPNMHFSRESLGALMAHPWPGNVRELVNVVEYVVALTRADAVMPTDLPREILAQAGLDEGLRPVGDGEPPLPLDRAVASGRDEARVVREALERNQWHRIETARELGINRVTLYRIMRRQGIVGPRGQRRRREPAGS